MQLIFVFTRYEVGVGSYPGGQDIHAFEDIGLLKTATLTNLALPPGTEVYVSARAVNEAGLISGAVPSGVHISPDPTIHVQDGISDEDMDFQNDISSVSGKARDFRYFQAT